MGETQAQAGNCPRHMCENKGTPDSSHLMMPPKITFSLCPVAGEGKGKPAGTGCFWHCWAAHGNFEFHSLAHTAPLHPSWLPTAEVPGEGCGVWEARSQMSEGQHRRKEQGHGRPVGTLVDCPAGGAGNFVLFAPFWEGRRELSWLAAWKLPGATGPQELAQPFRWSAPNLVEMSSMETDKPGHATWAWDTQHGTHGDREWASLPAGKRATAGPNLWTPC